MMAGSHPYISGAGNIAQMINHLRKNFPASVDSSTVKKLGIAPNNESYVINALQYIGVIDKDGKKTSTASDVFSHHKDEDFAKSFEGLIKASYSELFDLHGEQTWGLSKDDLITFFRRTDDTSATIGGRQANTFVVLAALSGHGKIPESKPTNNGSLAKKTPSKQPKPSSPKKSNISKIGTKDSVQLNQNNSNRDFGLTVRVEINLPSDGTKETYDDIFKSIKENLMND